MRNGKSILITGASGFIGGHVCKRFAQEDVNMFCLVRESSITDFIKDLPVTLLHGDITDYDRLVEACSKMDMVIHTAAHCSDWGDWDDFYSTNVVGTMNVMRAAKVNGIKDIILTGSVSSYGEEDSNVLKDEQSDENSHYNYFLDNIFPSAMNYYRDSKKISTQLATEYARKENLNLTVVEPVWVYGENEFSSGFYEYLKTVKSGMPFMPGSKRNQFHVIYAGDLASLYYQVFTRKIKGIHRIIAGNEHPEKMYSIFDGMCREAGLKIPKRIPRFLIYPPAFMLELFARIRRSKNPPLLTRARVNMFYDTIGFRVEKAKELVGFVAETPLQEGIRKTVQWYKQQQYL